MVKNNWTLESSVVVFFFELDGSVMGIEWFVVGFYRWNKHIELHFSVVNVIPLEKNSWLFTVPPEQKKNITHKKRTFLTTTNWNWMSKNEKKREVYIIRIIKNQQHFVFITNFIYFIGLFMLRNGFLVAICSFLFLLESHFCVSLFTRSFDFVFQVWAADAFV